MHINKRYFLPLAVLVVALGILLTNLLTTEPLTAEQIIENSREHFDTVSSFETNVTHYFNPNLDQPTTRARMRIEPPANFTILNDDGSTRIIAIENTVYRPVESEHGKWSRSVNENAFGNSNEQNLLVGFFPPTFFQSELVEFDSDTYAVEGFGTTYNNLGLPSGTATWHRLTIRKSDSALVESIKWDFPTVTLDENGEVVETFPQPTNGDGTTPFAHMRTITEITRYNEDLSIIPPPETDIIVELLRTWPKDLETGVTPRDDVGFHLSEPTPIMDLTIEPPIRLVPTVIDHPALKEFPGVVVFKPEDFWTRDTTYTVTLTYGESGEDLRTRSWSFTTR
ncbi:MAG: hypothetical protein HQ477_05970 [Chloroflexi bacterium]|nr:hypothetical protein [Chloroflexota bacterium]